MDKRINECLNGNYGSYILPFLWLHGEPKERIREEILAIYNSGIKEFCAESRPYERFLCDEWWDDFGFILKTAKELGMRVWLLDDKKFPTGYAGGYLEKEENAYLRKKLIREYQIDVIGPMKCAKLCISARVKTGERVIGAIAYRHLDGNESLDSKSATDLTDRINDGMIYWDIPAGAWRVCILVESMPFEYEGSRFFYYIDMINPDSCRAMIDAVYQPHYEHFKEYFGNTFAGFFSDEPGFLNLCDTYNNTLGIINSPYPYREDICDLIANSAHIEPDMVRLYLPALWENLGEVTSLVRAHYMETVTKLYSQCFTYQLGDWCRERGVMYIGHVIEDTNAHMRLAYGSGHYFRALDGQDMGGIDIVLMQDIPGFTDNSHRSPLADGGRADPSFFRYTLPKLAASHSHIQPLKKGRAMCEIFGAFGWAEGLPFMKGLADVMLCSGINYFVPHAFSPTMEDEDCPPHFYNGGKNIQYPLFKNLMSYMGRISHILSEGTHIADVALFYNAEGEWCGGENQLFSHLSKILTQGLVDFDIVPFDALKNATVRDGKLIIGNESYGALIISKSEILPYDRLSIFCELASRGLKVIFTDALPKKSAEGVEIDSMLSHFKTINSDCLVKELRSYGLCHISAQGKGISSLRFYHICRDSKDIYLFSNEDINSDTDADIFLDHEGECLVYEPWDNRIYKSSVKDGKLHLKLEKGNMLVFIFGEDIPSDVPSLKYETERTALPLAFEISLMDECEDEYKVICADSHLFDITAPEHFPHFSGLIRYKASFNKIDTFTVLDLGQVGEVAEVYLNGVYLGSRINSPYKFDMSCALCDGENQLEIIVRANLAHRRRDYLSGYMQIPPSGLLGDISLCRYS